MIHQSLGIGGLLILLADVWAIVNVAQSGADAAKKALWIVLILVLPGRRFSPLAAAGAENRGPMKAS